MWRRRRRRAPSGRVRATIASGPWRRAGGGVRRPTGSRARLKGAAAVGLLCYTAAVGLLCYTAAVGLLCYAAAVVGLLRAVAVGLLCAATGELLHACTVGLLHAAGLMGCTAGSRAAVRLLCAAIGRSAGARRRRGAVWASGLPAVAPLQRDADGG